MASRCWSHVLLVRLLVLVLFSRTLAFECRNNLFEDFANGWQQRWTHSGQAKHRGGLFQTVIPATFGGDPAIQTTRAKQHYGLTRLLPKPLDTSEGLVFQYEIKFNNGHACGGAYIKLLEHRDGMNATDLDSTTPYAIMFGPDRCGRDARVHLIIHHRNPKTGISEEKHVRDTPEPYFDQLSHVYTLVLRPSKYAIIVDGEIVSSGDLHGRFDPPFQPPKHIPDPDASKPKDWVDEEKIADPDARKPSHWDDRSEIPDPTAQMPDGWLEHEPLLVEDPGERKPSDWDESAHGPWKPSLVPNPKCVVGCGKWKAPLVKNPKFRGVWKPPRILNPAYKGAWKPPMVPNPAYFAEGRPLDNVAKIGGIAIEIWTTDEGYIFDSIMLGHDEEEAARYRLEVWSVRNSKEVAEREAALAAAERTEARGKLSQWQALVKTLDDVLDTPTLAWAKPLVASAQAWLGPPLVAVRRVLERHPALAVLLLAALLSPLFRAVIVGLRSEREGDDFCKQRRRAELAEKSPEEVGAGPENEHYDLPRAHSDDDAEDEDGGKEGNVEVEECGEGAGEPAQRVRRRVLRA